MSLATSVRNHFWTASAAALSALLLLAAVLVSGRVHGAQSLVSFQTMLSVAPWLALLSLGMDKGARQFAAPSSDSSGYLGLWRLMLIPVAVFGLVFGSLAAWAVSEPLIGWVLFCSLGALAAFLNSGRELMLARGQTREANRLLSFGLIFSLIGILLFLVLPATPLLMALLWMAPQTIAALFSARLSGLLNLGPPRLRGARLQASLGVLRSCSPLAAQWAGYVALASFDVLLVRHFCSDIDALHYILLTRSLFFAFSISGMASTLWVRSLNSESGLDWLRGFAASLACHLFFAVSAALVLLFYAPALFEAIVPSFASWHGLGSIAAPLLALAVSRAGAETSFSATFGGLARPSSFGLTLSSLGALALVAMWGPSTYLEALWCFSAAWLAPSLCLGFWLLKNKTLSTGHPLR